MKKKCLSQENLELIRNYILNNPQATMRDIAKTFNISVSTAHKYNKLIRQGLGTDIEKIVLNPKLEMSNVINLFNEQRDDLIEILKEFKEGDKEKNIKKIMDLIYLIKDIEKDKQELLMKWGFQPNKAFESIEKISKIIYEVIKDDTGNREED